MKKLSYALAACLMLVGCNKSDDVDKRTEAEICHVEKIELAVNEVYNLFMMTNSAFANETLTISGHNKEILGVESDIGILCGLKIGETTIKVSSAKHYQNITISVKDDEYMNSHFTVDRGRLWNKVATFYGDSITDKQTRPGGQYTDTYSGVTYWAERIKDYAQMNTIHNFAKSGATAGWNKSFANQGLSYNFEFAFNQVKNSATENQNADYAFVFIGTNDYMRSTPLGSMSDDPKTIEESETFNGALNYMYKTLLSYNPKIRIVALELAYATWGQDSSHYGYEGYGTSRDAYTNVIKNVANHYGFITIPTQDLWNSSNWQTYIPDGIHPAAEGQEKIALRVLGEC